MAHKFSGHLVFVMLNGTRDAFLMRPAGLDPRRLPAFGIAATDEMEAERFGFDTGATTPSELAAFWNDTEAAYAKLNIFCRDFLDGKLEASHESSEIPKQYQWPGPGFVHEVTWKTFRVAVNHSEHDVLFELYNPFRPQHRTHVLALELAAEALRNNSGVKVARMDTQNNFVPPEFGNIDKEKASNIFFIRASGPRRPPKRYAGKSGKAEYLPEKLLRFVHRETRGHAPWDVEPVAAWLGAEALKRIKHLRALEKDYEKKMQEEWMQKEVEEFERYKREGKFDGLGMDI